jgi:hypothetical protein
VSSIHAVLVLHCVSLLQAAKVCPRTLPAQEAASADLQPCLGVCNEQPAILVLHRSSLLQAA